MDKYSLLHAHLLKMSKANIEKPTFMPEMYLCFSLDKNEVQLKMIPSAACLSPSTQGVFDIFTEAYYDIDGTVPFQGDVKHQANDNLDTFIIEYNDIKHTVVFEHDFQTSTIQPQPSQTLIQAHNAHQEQTDQQPQPSQTENKIQDSTPPLMKTETGGNAPSLDDPTSTNNVDDSQGKNTGSDISPPESNVAKTIPSSQQANNSNKEIPAIKLYEYTIEKENTLYYFDTRTKHWVVANWIERVGDITSTLNTILENWGKLNSSQKDEFGKEWLQSQNRIDLLKRIFESQDVKK